MGKNVSKACKGLFFLLAALVAGQSLQAQLRWVEAGQHFGSLPRGIKVFQSEGKPGGKPFRAFYVEADLQNRDLRFSNDTTQNRRLTPTQYYEKNQQAAIVVNTSFFSFQTHQNLNMVVEKGKLLSYNIHSVRSRGKDSLLYQHPFGSAIGFRRSGKADIAWTFTDSNHRKPFALQKAITPLKDSFPQISLKRAKAYLHHRPDAQITGRLRKWRVKTAVGGGPVLVQDGKILVTNNEEMKFAGKAIGDAHPRTAMGYTASGKLIILVVEGRNPGTAEGATLMEMAEIFVSLGCVEAMNLDGGGSSCLLVNGKETIRPSDKGIQRPIPAAFLIRSR